MVVVFACLYHLPARARLTFVFFLSKPFPFAFVSLPQAEESDDYMTLAGTVEFEDVATAKAVVEKYNGMDMGMGSALEILPA